MTKEPGGRNLRGMIRSFRTSNNRTVSLLRDILWIGSVVGGIGLALILVCGTWPAVVAIESKSMDPHMKMGDLVVVVQKDRYGSFRTWQDGSVSNYTMFEEYGDVIIYRPNGMTNITPIIHRAIQYVGAGKVMEIKGKTLAINYTAIHPGYITWGDNNPLPDQFYDFPKIGIMEPVRDEWVVGKALFTIPLVGYLPLNIVFIVIMVLLVLILHGICARFSKPEKKPGPLKKKK